MVGAHTLDESAFDLGIAPASDSGLAVGVMFGAVVMNAGVLNVRPPESALSLIN
jgi:hypothetical protein